MLGEVVSLERSTPDVSSINKVCAAFTQSYHVSKGISTSKQADSFPFPGNSVLFDKEPSVNTVERDWWRRRGVGG